MTYVITIEIVAINRDAVRLTGSVDKFLFCFDVLVCSTPDGNDSSVSLKPNLRLK